MDFIENIWKALFELNDRLLELMAKLAYQNWKSRCDDAHGENKWSYMQFLDQVM